MTSIFREKYNALDLIGNNNKEKKIDVARELNDIEEDALKRFKKNDEEIVRLSMHYEI